MIVILRPEEQLNKANAGGNGQDIQRNLLGSILRIDVDEGDPYGIPADNPFAATPGCADGCDEIFAYGFRNPYRFSFDLGGAHRLFAGDAGQELWEEVSIVDKGGNYGWNVKEGTHCFDTDNPDVSPPECPDNVGKGHPRAGDPLIDPVIGTRIIISREGWGRPSSAGSCIEAARYPNCLGGTCSGTGAGRWKSPTGRCSLPRPERGACG